MVNGVQFIIYRRHPELLERGYSDPVEGEFVYFWYNRTFALQLSHSIKVVRQILILFVEVRILVGQQLITNR